MAFQNSSLSLGIFVFLIFVSFSIATDALLPELSGKYDTVVTTMKLVDKARIDPFSPTNSSRNLMISAFQPVTKFKCSTSLSDYMPPTTASFYDSEYSVYGIPNGSFDHLKLQVCLNPSTYRDDVEYPVLIFSPGLGNSRFLYNSLVQSIAGTGYIVISIDHPYDADIVEYPDGSFVLAADIETIPQIELALATRVQDVSFVLNQLSSPSIIKSLMPGLTNGLNVHEVGIFGHSLGGATSIAAMVNDSRIIGGINLDGTFFGPSIQQGTKRPSLLVGHEGKNQSTDASWEAQWQTLSGWKLELEVNGAAHASFSDLPTLVDVLGLAESLPAASQEILGSITGPRFAEIKQAYISAFFDFVLKGKMRRILSEESKEFPEVEFVDKDDINEELKEREAKR